jgi:hypothetical protein
MNFQRALRLFFFCVTAFVIYALVAMPWSFANPPDNRPPDNRPPDHGGGNSNVDVDVGGTDIDIGGTTVNAGDVSVPVDVNAATTVNSPVSMQNETKTFAFSNSLGDVDIAACLGSEQWSTPVYGQQKLKLNQVCMAEFYLKNGLYDLAAMSLCNVKEILKEFEGKGIKKDDAEAACEAAHTFGPTVADIAALEPAAAPPFESFEEHNEDVVEIQMAQQALQMEVQELRAELDAERRRPPPPPRVVQQEAEPRLTDAEKYAILGLLVGEDEDE